MNPKGFLKKNRVSGLFNSESISTAEVWNILIQKNSKIEKKLSLASLLDKGFLYQHLKKLVDEYKKIYKNFREMMGY